MAAKRKTRSAPTPAPEPVSVNEAVLEEVSSLFPWSIVYRTPYDEDSVVGLFTSKLNAEQVHRLWSKSTHDDEELVVRPTWTPHSKQDKQDIGFVCGGGEDL